MEKQGFHTGLTMIEALALSFHQDYYLDGKTAKENVESFINECPDLADLEHLRAEFLDVMNLPSEASRIKHLHKLGLGYWPPKERVSDVFSDGLNVIEERLKA